MEFEDAIKYHQQLKNLGVKNRCIRSKNFKGKSSIKIPYESPLKSDDEVICFIKGVMFVLDKLNITDLSQIKDLNFDDSIPTGYIKNDFHSLMIALEVILLSLNKEEIDALIRSCEVCLSYFKNDRAINDLVSSTSELESN